MALRISFGIASCREPRDHREPGKSICSIVLEKLETLRLLRKEQLDHFDEQEPERLLIGGHEAILTTYKRVTKDGDLLVIVQAFYPTFWFPNYISVNGVGKLFADGILIRKNGQIEDAPIDLLLEYQ